MPCLFCQQTLTPLLRFTHCYAAFDQYPVSPGHTLIIPYTHIPDWFSAPPAIQHDILHALASLKAQLDASHHPDGYNIGLNCGAAAGQTIFHLHVHLIPRYHNDTTDPRGGVRGVIPAKQKY